MAKPQEFLSDLPILSVVPIDTFGNGRVSQPYFRDGDWRYKDVMGEHLLCPQSTGATTYTTAELSVLFGADLYLSHPLSVSGNPLIFILPMLHCIQGERGYINGDRITALDVVCQFLPTDIRVTIPQNGIKIPRRSGNRKFFTSLLTLEEKEIAARYNIGNLDEHEADFTVAEVRAWNFEYHQSSVKTRTKRKQWVETLIYRDLSIYGNQVATAMRYSPAGDLIARYQEYGQKGTVEDFSLSNLTPLPGIIDYLYSRSIFDGAGDNPGLSSQPWQPRGERSLSDLIEEIAECLVSGIYR